MEQDDLGDWLSPLSRNNEAQPSPYPLAAPPGTPHAGVGAGAGLVHGSSATNDPAQPHAQQHTPTVDQHGQWAVPERAAQHQGNPLIPGIAPVGAMPQPAAATAYGCGQPLPQYNLGSCAIPGMVAQQQYWMPTFAQQPPLGILPARQGSSASCGTGFGSTPAAARQATTHDALWRQQPPTPQMAHLPGLGMPPGYPGFLPPGILPPGNAYHACGGAAHAPCYPSFAMPNGGGPTGLPPQAAWTLPNAVPQAAWAAPAWIPGCHMAAPPAAGSYCQPAPSSAVPGGSMPPAPTAPANAPEPISKVKDASTPEVAALKHVAGLRRDALPALLSRFHRDLSRKQR